MIRPWIGVLSVLLGVAALPGSAMAQTAPDTTAPTISIVAPTEGAQYTVGQPVSASFSCADDSGSVAECIGTVPSGNALNTSAAGPGDFTVTAKDAAGNSFSKSVHYSVVEADNGDVGGSAPATLTLTLGPAAAFSSFLPGQSRDYLATMTAQVLSTAANATLSVADPSAEQTGHLVNGTYFLPKALEAGAASGSGVMAASMAPIGGSASPTTLLTWNDIVNEPITLTFKQPIAAGDALRTGGYAKSLTFTLSTTAP